MTQSNNKPRYEWVDTMKFLGIFAIYIGHLGANAGKIYPFVFSFHVPLFFFAAGFFAKHTAGNSLLQFTLSKAQRLILPYFAFALLTLIIMSISSGSDFATFTKALAEIGYGVRNSAAVGSLWFINCLFVIFIIDFIFSRLTTSNTLLLLISIVSFILSQTLLGHNPLRDPRWFFNIDSALAYWWPLADRYLRCFAAASCLNSHRRG